MAEPNGTARGTPGEVFLAFLKLGLTSFGGPIAHLGYFRDELVTRRRWLDEAAYADLVALCQFLPGPASSQVGFALGMMRAGWLGALAAWTAFTLPSALLLIVFALGAASLDGPVAAGVLHGLKLVAVAIVAQAVLGMAKSLTPDRERAAIAAVAVLILVLLGGTLGQVAAIGWGGLVGLRACRSALVTSAVHPFFGSRTMGAILLAMFALLLVGMPFIAGWGQGLAIFDAFYRAGALVFGGGHVVLPLLETETVARGWVTPDAFLAGYGAAQAVPGPLFTFAAYLGTVAGGLPGAAIALVAIFLPGLLLVAGALPFWDQFRRWPWAQAAMRGANAAVVGVLAAALYDPVFLSAVLTPLDFAMALAGFVALVAWKCPPWIVVLALGAMGGVIGAM
ncbi:chromate transporter [Devosia lucknowensis]|uniref:Chromate transporter n=1 Tax=Devosia lucknowensis TaxID=1096929 RepID=A0A1Y6EEL4_9HYPH|nr:chromate efflux transporter [Devosia lucknowensis]SMQ61017.1 chromate transporter [Devosia lucknowensis]